MTCTIRLHLDETGMTPALAELLALFERLEGPVEYLAGLGERLANFIQLGPAFHFNTDAALGTSDIWLRPEPSNTLLDVLAALRAGDCNLIERHLAASSMGCGKPEDVPCSGADDG